MRLRVRHSFQWMMASRAADMINQDPSLQSPNLWFMSGSKSPAAGVPDMQDTLAACRGLFRAHEHTRRGDM